MAYAPAMAHTPIRRVAALGGSAVLALTLPIGAAPASADDTSTHITSPSSPKTVLVDGTTPELTISGSASVAITSVDIYCTRGTDVPQVSKLIEADVPSNGSFTVTTPLPDLGPAGPVCRLQALPSSTQPDAGATTAYTGPLLYVDTVTRTVVGSDTVDFRMTAGNGGGQMSAKSAGKCGDASLAPLLPGLGAAQGAGGCVGSLGGTSGSLRVDGHPGLLPLAVSAFTDDTSAVLSTSFHVARTGRLTWTESAPVRRCQDTDVYPPPSPAQCGQVVATGVRYQRRGTLDVSGQVRLRDSFVSTDGVRHRLQVSYGMESDAPSTGALGFAFPGRTGGFHGSQAGQVVTGLPARAATILVRTDRFSSEGDPQAATRAITYSRPPARLAFSGIDATAFGMHYALTVPKNDSVRLGFTDNVAIRTTVARALGRRAADAMMPSPRITSPAKGAVLPGKRTVVKGVVRAGANGLPVSVTVNGHRATLTATSAARATFKAVFDESLGRHTLTAVARDAGGNKRSTSITVRNK